MHADNGLPRMLRAVGSITLASESHSSFSPLASRRGRGDALTGHTEEVVNGGDVVHGVGEHAHLLLPLLFEEHHVIQGHLAVGLARQGQSRVNHLQLQIEAH